METKICKQCARMLSITAFYNRYNKCKECVSNNCKLLWAKKKASTVMSSTLKMCGDCAVEKPVNLFRKNKRNKDGYTKSCIACLAKQKEELREKRLKQIPAEKICVKCKKIQKIEMFNKSAFSSDGHLKICRICKNLANNTKPIEPEHSRICKKCYVSKPLADFRKNKANTKCFHICLKCWEPRKWTREKAFAKYKKDSQDINRKLRARLNKRIRCALKEFLTKKTKTTLQYLGCNIGYFKLWIEYQFEAGMNWENMSKWHIDHVKPCATYDLNDPISQSKCFHWSNLRPCFASENIKKGNKIINEIIVSQEETVKRFLEVNPLPTLPGDREEGAE